MIRPRRETTPSPGGAARPAPRPVPLRGCLAAVWLATATVLPACGRLGFDLLDSRGGGQRPDPDAAAAPDGSVSDAGPPPLDSRPPGDARPDAAGESGADGGGRDASPFDATRDGPTETSPPPLESGTPDADAGPPDGPSPVPEASPPDVAPPDAASVACPGAKDWSFDFDSDPTLADSDGDGVLDWVMRNASTFPLAELQGGVWRSETRVVLDSRPTDDFAARTVVDLRMRSLAVPTTTGRGAVFWVNLNQGGPTFSALFVGVGLEPDGGQTFTLFGKVGNVESAIVTLPDLPEDLLDVHLDIDPVSLSVTLSIDGSPRGSYAIPETGAPNADHFATLLLWEGIAEFDSIRIQRCQP